MARLLIVIGVVVLVAAIAVFVRRRNLRSTRVEFVDLSDFEFPTSQSIAIIGFFSKFCLACQQWSHELEAAELAFSKIDVSTQHQLTQRYGVLHTPVVMAISTAHGRVLRWHDEAPEPATVTDLRQLVTSTRVAST